MKKSVLALAAVLVLALTVFVSTGSASNVQPKPFQSTGFSSGADSDVRSTTPDQDVRGVHAPKVDVCGVHAPKVDVRTIGSPDASKAWAVKAWSSKGW